MVKPSKQNPRSKIADDTLAGLQESIERVGILQPILVRPVNGHYEIVCGHRRYQAAKNLKLGEVPVTIRELDDEQAYEAAIIENLQREDIHPLDEGFALYDLSVRQGLDYKALRAAIGRSDKYVAQRISFTRLTQEIQAAFREGKYDLSNSVAFKLSRMSAETQAKLFAEKVQAPNYGWRYLLEYGQKIISQAGFNPKDENLVEDAPACTGCQFNSAAQNLLFDDGEFDKNAVCSSPGCFDRKVEAHARKQIDKAVADGMFVCLGWNAHHDHIKPLVKYAKDQDGAMIVDNSDWSHAYAPEKPSKPRKGKNQDEASHKAAQLRYQERLAEYEADKAEWDQKIADGKVVRAYVVGDGREWIRLPRKVQGSTEGAQAGATNELQDQLDKKIARQKRALELDREKLNAEVNRIVRQDEYLNSQSGGLELFEVELVAAILAVVQSIGYGMRSGAKMITGTDPERVAGIVELLKMDRKQLTRFLNHLLRFLIVDNLPTRDTDTKRSPAAYVLDELVQTFYKAQYDEAAAELDLLAKKRLERHQKAVDKLKAQISDLKAKQKTKKSAGSK